MPLGRTSKMRDRRPSPRVVAAAVGLAVLVVPSAAGSASTTTTTTSASTTTTTAGSTTTTTAPKATGGGCEKTVRFGTSTLHVRVGGHTRTVLVHVPRSYTATIRVPLVLNLHGSGGTAAAEERLTGMDAQSELDGFLVAYPQALIRSGSGFDWNIPGEPLPDGVRAPAHPPDDLAFLTLLVGDLEGDYCVNIGRVYATGFSGGARMTSVLACDDSNFFAAVAPVSGLRWPDPCPTIRAVPLLAIHGSADHVDPYRGHGQPYWTYSVPEAAADWAHQDDCRSRPVVAPEKHGVDVTAFLSCPGHAAVELLTVQGGGHVWPGGTALGPGAKVLDADSLIWAFFSAHRIR
jgi:polyhydroxybutyrate depolymerase